MKKEFHPSEIPAEPGVYVFRDRFGKVIYVGKAGSLRRRLSSYFQPSRLKRADAKLRSLVNSIDDWSIQTVRTEDEALILESRLIKEYAPHYNILMRDDKRYLMLKIDLREKFPTFKLARVKKDDRARYFGPFPHGSALRSTLEFLLARFGLRACRDSEPDGETRKRCLQRIVKDCSAPCTGAISETEYRLLVERVLGVLEGDIGELKAEMQARMAEAAAARRFETAAKYRDMLSNLETVFGARNRSFERPELPEPPGGKTAARELEAALGLPRYPETIVCFDNSNLMGAFAVSSMVVFRDGRPDRSGYRRFRVKTIEGSDDFGTMREVIGRHFGRLLREKRELPDLLVVDGGRGQLSAALEALVELACPPLAVIGLAKRNEEIFLPGRDEPIRLDRHGRPLRLLQALRDESHRFAITYHRELRNRAIEQSLLDELPGIGKARKDQLLKEFGSIRELRKSSPETIAARVPGIGMILAEKIVDFLK